MYRRANLFYRVLDALFRNQKLVVTTLLCVAIPVGFLLIIKSKGYMATGAIRIVQEAIAVRKGGGGDIDTFGWKTAAELHVDNLTSLLRDTKAGGFVDLTLQKAALNPPVSFAPGSNDKRIEAFLNNVSLKKEQDNLFSFTLNWAEEQECQRLVKALQDQYIEEQLRGKQQSSQKTAEFLEKQIQQAQIKVNAAAQAYQRNQQQHLDVGPDQQQQTTDYITLLKDRLSRAKVAAAAGGKLNPQLRDLKPYMALDTGDVSASGSTAQKRLIDLTEQRTRLTTGEGAFRKDTETIRALDRQIDRARLDIAKERRQGGAKRQNPIFERLMAEASNAAAASKGSAKEVQELEQQIADEETKLRSIPAIKRQSDALITDLNAHQAYLAKLRESYNEALRKANLEREQASLVLQTVGDVYAISLAGPKKKVTMGLVSLLIGLIVAGLMVAVREWSDPTLRYESDIEHFLEVPVLTGLTETRAVLAPKAMSAKPDGARKRTRR